MKNKIKWFAEDGTLIREEKCGVNTIRRTWKAENEKIDLRALMALVADISNGEKLVTVFGFRLKSGERK